MPRLVKFLGGPCDGLECRDDSPDQYHSAVAVVWTLLRIGCGGPLDVRQALRLLEIALRRPSPGPFAAARSAEPPASPHYRVISRREFNGATISVAAFTPIDRSKT